MIFADFMGYCISIAIATAQKLEPMFLHMHAHASRRVLGHRKIS